MNSRVLNRQFAWQLLLVLMLSAVALVARAQNGDQPFALIDPPQATDAPGKVEVLAFFQYGCPHCRAMEPLMLKWEPKLADDVLVRHVPVAFNASMAPWQFLYYSLEALDRRDLQAAVFNSVQTERNPLNSAERVFDWAAKQGLDRAEFESMYKSFGVAAKVKRAQQLIQAYSIQSVPTMAVGGRYLTSPALANGYQQSLDVTDDLIERVRQNA
ncbi:MAG: thiol:disulfide interchange protein DsbA/DsbL [Pigmentiphaga sp.]